MKQTHSKIIQVLKEKIKVQVMETLIDKSAQAKKKVDKLEKLF